MKITYQDEHVQIIDNFLCEEDWECVTDQIEADSYEQIPHGDDPSYKLNSGPIFKSTEKYWYSKYPWENNYEPFMNALIDYLKSNDTVIENAFTEASLMTHVYRAGAELSWHGDGVYYGGYSFYAHSEWRHTWGGDLLIADYSTDLHLLPYARPKTKLYDLWGRDYNMRGSKFNLLNESISVSTPGMGKYFMPLPNRLMLVSGGVIHKVERVDNAAGDNCRVSLTGFFE